MPLRSRKVVLFSPPYRGPLLGPPLGLLSLAGTLRAHGYEPILIDGALDRAFASTVAREVMEATCFGVSLLTGPMILDAIEVSRMVRRLRPDLPIVFGGWHPTLCSAETLRESFVDVVVRQQGELTLVEILRRWERASSLDLVPGCWFKRNGHMVRNPDRPTVRLDELPAPAYDLLDMDAYEAASGVRKLPYGTSLGCPYACNYCTDTVFYLRRFNAYEAARVVEELTRLAQEHRLREVALVDSNFLVDVHRAVAIAQGIVDRGVRFRWSFQASTDLLCRMSDDEVRLLARSGVHHIGFGTESASPAILRKMNKRHQEVEDMYEAARKCQGAGIRVTFNLIFGFPGEEAAQRRETMRVMGDIAAKYPNVQFSPNLFTPYPGIPIWPELREQGLPEPQSLLEWAEMDLGGTALPWLKTESLVDIERGMAYFMLRNRLNKLQRKGRSAVMRGLGRVLAMPVHWRIRNACFALPWELAWSSRAEVRPRRRSLLTGQPLPAGGSI